MHKGNLPSNRYKWWLTNFKIRKALLKIRQDVEERLQHAGVVSLYVVSESHVAKVAGISRASLMHSRRKVWVVRACESIRKTIKSSREKANERDTKIEEMSFLKIQLNTARQETFVWYNKVLKLEQDIAGLQKVIATLKKALNSGNGSNNSRLLGVNKTT